MCLSRTLTTNRRFSRVRRPKYLGAICPRCTASTQNGTPRRGRPPVAPNHNPGRYASAAPPSTAEIERAAAAGTRLPTDREHEPTLRGSAVFLITGVTQPTLIGLYVAVGFSST